MNPTHPSTPKPTGVSAEPKSAPTAPAAQEDSFAAMLEASFNAPKPKEGTLISGTIVRITDKVLIVDVGYKSEGILPIDEVRDAAGVVPFKVGDTIEALVERLSLGTGDVLLSIKRAKQLKAWDRLEAAHLSGEPVEGVVVEKTRGGLFVDIDGVRAFLPGSLTDVRRRSLDDFLNRAVTVKVIKLNKKSQNIVVSRKEIVEVEEEHRRSQLAEQLQSGVVLHGTVKNLTEFGAFIDVGGLDGLLRLGDMSWGKVKHPSEMFSTGQEIEVVVLKFDAKKCKLDLGFKQRLPNPWESAVERFPVGARVTCRPRRDVVDVGAGVGQRVPQPVQVHVLTRDRVLVGVVEVVVAHDLRGGDVALAHVQLLAVELPQETDELVGGHALCFSLQVMQTRVQGIALSLASAISSPQSRHTPYVPFSILHKASSIA